MAQPDTFTQEYNGRTITADRTMVEVRDGTGLLYRRSLPNNQHVCTMTNFQCGKVWVDGR